jgi:hypothetical protein
LVGRANGFIHHPLRIGHGPLVLREV